MKFAYVRVSTEEQNVDRQIVEIKTRYPDIKDKHIFVDKRTGKNIDRPNYQKLKSLVEILDGDNGKVELIIHEMDRLGRDKSLIKEELAWFKTNGVVVRILNLPTTLIDIQDDTMGIMGMVHNILVEVLSTMAETEMLTRSKRQREGINVAKSKGIYKGRQRIEVNEVDFEMVYKLWKAKEITATKAMHKLGLKANTFYRRINEYEGNLVT